MTKTELVEATAKGAGTTKADAQRCLDAAIAAITGTLKKGQKVILVGFGTFSVSKRKARKGRNPQTGQEIKIPAMKVPKFTAGKTLRDTVNKGK